jgi:hypothetical protein
MDGDLGLLYAFQIVSAVTAKLVEAIRATGKSLPTELVLLSDILS